jgi:hypothetical protein
MTVLMIVVGHGLIQYIDTLISMKANPRISVILLALQSQQLIWLLSMDTEIERFQF